MSLKIMLDHAQYAGLKSVPSLGRGYLFGRTDQGLFVVKALVVGSQGERLIDDSEIKEVLFRVLPEDHGYLAYVHRSTDRISDEALAIAMAEKRQGVDKFVGYGVLEDPMRFFRVEKTIYGVRRLPLEFMLREESKK